jgi:hypothetical protein
MTHEIPQFYRQWIPENLKIPVTSDFVYHTGEQYAYLIMGGPKDAPGNLFIFVFKNPDSQKRRKPEYLKMHRIQATEILVDHIENLLNALGKTD